MEGLLPHLLNRHFSRPARSLREACQRSGLDKGGRRCVECRRRQLCHEEARWVATRMTQEYPKQNRG